VNKEILNQQIFERFEECSSRQYAGKAFAAGTKASGCTSFMNQPLGIPNHAVTLRS
jgi:hypothetical protein